MRCKILGLYLPDRQRVFSQNQTREYKFMAVRSRLRFGHLAVGEGARETGLPPRKISDWFLSCEMFAQRISPNDIGIFRWQRLARECAANKPNTRCTFRPARKRKAILWLIEFNSEWKCNPVLYPEARAAAALGAVPVSFEVVFCRELPRGLSANILRILRPSSAGVKGFRMSDTPGFNMSARINSPLYPVM
jgi:hypothetical protein